jgi:FAD:protein FMN transferase
MASPLRLTACWDQADPRIGVRGIESAWRAVRAEFEAIEVEMSRFRDSSDLTRLNRAAGTGLAVPVPRRLERALVAADRAHRMTDGRFDPRVLRDLEQIGYPGAPLAEMDPEPSRDADGRGPILRRAAPGSVAVDEPVDLGGIGKGLALRWGTAIVERHGIDRFILEAGGDLVARGAGPDGGTWLVGIENPAVATEPLVGIAIEDAAVATSSVRVRSWVHDGRPVHHLVDPRTRAPADAGLQAVTVLGPDPAWAEVWSKTLFVGGRAGIAREARERGLAAWWITDEGTVEMTAAARARSAWVAGEA